MAQFDLNRAQDTPIATLKLNEITPKNWHRYPPRVESMVRANPNEGKPRYLGAGATADWTGGEVGDDIDTASANVAIARSDSVNVWPDYTPRTQADRAAQLGEDMAPDIGAPRGPIEPHEPYPVAGDPPVADPVVASISPTTGAAASLPLTVTITGTGFTPYSTVYTGGSSLPEQNSVYLSPTQMKVPIWAASPGTVSVAVKDHGVMSNEDIDFTVT